MNRKGGPLARLAKRAGREIAEHPVETIAVCAMTLAIARLALRQERAIEMRLGRPRGRKRLIAPISLVAAMCVLMFSS